MKESHIRSIVKAISWRITASVTTILITYFVVGSATIAFEIGLFDLLIKLALYYFHERCWIKIPLGLDKYEMEYEI